MKQDLQKYKNNIYSQWGEDGILEELLKRLGISNYEDIWVVEFGAWDGKHLSNTFNLIEQGANSVLIEGDTTRYSDLLETKKQYKKIIPINAFVSDNGENSLDNLISKTPIKSEYEILSIDVDSYENLAIWKNYKGNPKIVIIEINSSFLPYEKNISNNLGNTFFDTNKVGEEKGYKLVAHTPNMIFVKKKEIEKIYPNLRYKSHQLYDYIIFLKWRNISRLKTINYLFKNFNKVSIIAMLIKLLPQKAMLFIIEKFYEKESPT